MNKQCKVTFGLKYFLTSCLVEISAIAEELSLIERCSMTVCFSFDVLTKLNPI